MRVTCENCSTKFNLDESRVKFTGSKVRCSRCKHIFTVYPPQPEEEAAVLDMELGYDEPEASEGEDLDTGAVEEAIASDFFPDEETVPEEEEMTDDLDLSDIEKMLQVEGSPEEPVTGGASSAGEEPVEEGEDDFPSEEEVGSGLESLDLSDFEKILEDSDEGDELLEEKSEDDQDLVFDLDEDLDLQAAEEQLSPTTELDLGDLEKMFESEEESESSLDLEPEPEDTGLMLPEVEEEVLSGDTEPGAETELLGFDVDMDSEEGSSEEGTLDLGGETLDLNLDLEDELSAETPAEEPESLNLEPELDMDLGASMGEAPAGETEDLGLTLTLEPDMDEAAPDEEAAAGETEGLGLELEPESESPGLVLEPDTDEDAGTEEKAEGDGSLSEQLEMAFDAPEEGAAEIVADEGSEEASTDFDDDMDVDFPDDAVPDIPDEDEDFVIDDEAEEELEEEGAGEIEVEKTPKRGGKKVVLWILSVILVLLVAFAALVFLNFKGIVPVPYLDQLPIPFLSSQKASQGADSGNLKILTSDVDSRFLENDKAGRMFIITGKVKNDYSEVRSHIQVSGSLYTRGKTLADTATAYCGNIIADLELSQMTPAAVRTRLGTPSGDNNTNVNVESGGERPFMIVFFNLPESLDEFTVAVRSSEPADK
jgi:predicted Zn finger-like uncharacterized protein